MTSTVPLKIPEEHLVYEKFLSNTTWAEGAGACSEATTGIIGEMWVYDKSCAKLNTVYCEGKLIINRDHF